MAVAARVGRAFGQPELDSEVGNSGPEISLADPPGGWANPWLVGLAHEQAANAADRTRRGAFYTPRILVEGLVKLALSGDNQRPRFTVDPTCGGGAFLLAVLDHLVACGVAPAEAVSMVGGMDVDAGAVAVARTAVELWAIANGCEATKDQVVLGDALVSYPEAWPVPEAIIGNPPFASPLKSAAVDPVSGQFREARPDLFGPYADTAACHLVRAVELLDGDGVVCLVQPVSVLAGRDTENMRLHLNEVAPVQTMWCTTEAVFDAGVRVAAPVLQRGAKNLNVTLATGPKPNIVGSVSVSATSEKWSALAAMALGVPWVDLDESSCLGDIASATAGFRDEHYGLAAACVEQADSNSALRLTTVGSIDPLFTWWGRRPTRFARQLWDKPVIDPDLLDAKVRRWLENQLKPKVVLPTQSKVLEPFVDVEGIVAPATPVLAIHAPVHQLHHIAAVLLAPPVVAWALQRSFGSAMSLDAVKLSATQVQRLPLPQRAKHWDLAAELLRTSSPETADEALNLAKSVAQLMMEAYGAKPEVMTWYETRFPSAETSPTLST